jgi:hypothetical protein
MTLKAMPAIWSVFQASIRHVLQLETPLPRTMSEAGYNALLPVALRMKVMKTDIV